MTKKTLSFCLSIALLLNMLFCYPVTANASTTNGSYLANHYYAFKMPNQSKTERIISFDSPYACWGKYSDLKSSNKSVAVSTASAHNGIGIKLTSTNFIGTTKISFKYNGKKYSFNYTVNRYTNPCKLFQIGSTNHTSKYNYKNTLWSKVAKNNQTLKLAAKSGWVIKEVKLKRTGYNKSGSDFRTITYHLNRSSFTTKVTLYETSPAQKDIDFSCNYIKVIYKEKSTGKIIVQYFCL